MKIKYHFINNLEQTAQVTTFQITFDVYRGKGKIWLF